eukprot:7385287-Prymnesium_polylepis.3
MRAYEFAFCGEEHVLAVGLNAVESGELRRWQECGHVACFFLRRAPGWYGGALIAGRAFVDG